MTVSQWLRCPSMLECHNFFFNWQIFLELSVLCYKLNHDLPYLAELHTNIGVLSLVDFHERTYKCTVFKFPFLWMILLWQLVEELFVTCHGTIIKTIWTGRNPFTTLPLKLCLLAVWMESYHPGTKQLYNHYMHYVQGAATFPFHLNCFVEHKQLH